MAQVDKSGTVTLEELIVSSLATSDALAKLLIEKKLITAEEFDAKLSAERTTYQRLLRAVRAPDLRAPRREGLCRREGAINFDCLRYPALVHSRNSTCATRRGFSHRIFCRSSFGRPSFHWPLKRAKKKTTAETRG